MTIFHSETLPVIRTENAFFGWLRDWDWDYQDIWAWVWNIVSYHITAYGIWGYLGVFLTFYVILYSWEVTRPFINLTNAFLFRSVIGGSFNLLTSAVGSTLAWAKDIAISMGRRLILWLKELTEGPRG